jgi:predicted transposase YdaD
VETRIADDHDRRYKRLFSHPGFVSRLLDSFVDEPFLRDLDLSTLELVNTSFVSGRHARRDSDVIWKLLVADSPVYFYLLIEFQSGVDETMPLRFLRYLTEFYESLVAQLDRTDALPAVFPLLLYNGDASWTVPRSVEQMIRATIPGRYIPHLSYYPVLINEIPAPTLRRIHNAVSAVFYVENAAPEDVAETIDVLIDILKEEVPEVSERFTEWFASYLAGQGLDITVDQPIRDLQEVKAMFATKFQEYSRRLKEEGLEQGREEGLSEGLEQGLDEGRTEGRAVERLAIARRLLERGETVEEVAELTGLSPDDVTNLAKGR